MHKFSTRRSARLLACSCLIFLSSYSVLAQTTAKKPVPAAPAQSDTGPDWIKQHPVTDSVTLHGETNAELMKRVQVKHQYQFADIKKNHTIMLGKTKLDFTKLLNNPKSPSNVAEKLRAMPQHAEVQSSSTEVTEIARGLIVHDLLSYRIKPNQCNDAGARQQLQTSGVSCFATSTPGARINQFSTKGNPLYIKDATKRAKAIAAYNQGQGPIKQAIQKRISELRQNLADPQKHAAIVAKIGAADAQHLSKLNDEQLGQEMLNRSVTTVEQTLFVPNNQSLGHLAKIKGMNIVPSNIAELAKAANQPHSATMAAPNPAANQLNAAIKSSGNTIAATSSPTMQQEIDYGPYFYLTGFTIGNDYEWSYTISFSIDWFFETDHYYIKAYAQLAYGFGLRFPIQASAKYHYTQYGPAHDQANVEVDFVPIEGTLQQFQNSGLGQNNQVFDAKEIVAEFKADAGLSWHLPFIGSGGFGPFGPDIDLTDELPAPFTGGRFTPPAPGTSGINALTLWLDDVDLLGDEADFGAGGAHVYPGVEVNLISNSVQFTLNDEIEGTPTTLTKTGQSTSLGMSNDNSRTSHFSIGNPVYNLAFNVTPGIELDAFIDLDVYSHDWKYPIWFPQLSIQLPPGGVNFSCHAGTVCSNDITASGLSKRNSGTPAPKPKGPPLKNPPPH